jgi:hypothetical protein
MATSEVPQNQPDRQTGPQKRKFESLDTFDRVRAILAGIRGPATKEKVIEMSEVNYDALDEATKARIEAVFLEEGVEKSREEENAKYRLSDEKREKLAETVDMGSVNLAIVMGALTRVNKAAQHLGFKPIDFE